MAVLLANNATSRLASSLTAAATTLSVTSGEGAKFPSPTGGDWFPLTLIKSSGALEILRCTARFGDVLVVTRAQEGTAAQAFSAGDRVEVRLTKAVMDAIVQQINDLTNSALLDANNLSDLTNVATARTNLGLGTAATKNAQTTPTDTTDGALMAVGAGGWLGSASIGSYIAGFPQTRANNISQIYRRESPDNGISPYSASIHFAAHDTWGRLRISYGTPTAWIQGGSTSRGATGWTAELYHTGNISSFAQTLLDDADASAARATLGAVSSTDVDAKFTGTNVSLAANGYQRLPSGLIIQWGIITGVTTSDVGVTFPTAFPTNTVHVGIQARGDRNRSTSSKEVDAPPRNITTTSFTLNAGPDTGYYGGVFLWFAIGY